MTWTIRVTTDQIENLDLSVTEQVIEGLLEKGEIASSEKQIQFQIDYERDPLDPRELSEIPEVRLWFVRLDVRYPWLPFLLDWQTGELARYVAMLVPHQFDRNEGIQYNPEALEIFVMQKVFLLSYWLEEQDIVSKYRLQSLTQMFGYELDNSFFDLLVK